MNRMRQVVGAWALGALWLAVGPAWAAPEPPLAPAYRLDKPPVIDGRLDDPAWQALLPVGPFNRLGGDGFAEPPTDLRLGWDQENLYLGLRLVQSQPPTTTIKTFPGPVYKDDSLEIFINPDVAGKEPRAGMAQVNLNAANVQGGTAASANGATWMSGTHIGQGHWSAEFALPWSFLKVKPQAGTVLRMTVFRKCTDGMRYSIWPGVGAKHGRADAAAFVLSDEPASPAHRVGVADAAWLSGSPGLGLNALVLKLSGAPPGGWAHRLTLADANGKLLAEAEVQGALPGGGVIVPVTWPEAASDEQKRPPAEFVLRIHDRQQREAAAMAFAHNLPRLPAPAGTQMPPGGRAVGIQAGPNATLEGEDAFVTVRAAWPADGDQTPIELSLRLGATGQPVALTLKPEAGQATRTIKLSTSELPAGRLEVTGTLQPPSPKLAATVINFGPLKQTVADLRRRLSKLPDARGWDAPYRVRLDDLEENLGDPKRQEVMRALCTEYERKLAELVEGLAMLERGQTPAIPRGQTFLMGYVSRIDDSAQPYQLYVPAALDADKPAPLVVNLPTSPGGMALFTGAEGETARGGPYLAIGPCGRGRHRYESLGWRDVQDAISDVSRRFKVDPERIYVTGLSMGGYRTMWLATRCPDRWAAVAPLAGSGEWEWAGNALNLPVFVNHGRDDTTVPVQVARLAFQELRRAGNTAAQFREYPGVGHALRGPALNEGKVLDWFGGFRRASRPEIVSYATRSMQHPGAYWAFIGGLADPLLDGRIRAAVSQRDGQNRIEVTTQNLLGYRLDLTRAPLAEGRPIRIVENGQDVATLNAGEKEYLKPVPVAPGHEAFPGLKRQGLSGPICDLFGDRFYIVRGAGGSADEQAAGQEAVKSLLAGMYDSGVWKQSFIVRKDTEVSEADFKDAHVFLVGTPASNRWLARIMDQLPLRIEGAAVVAHGDSARKWEGQDAGFLLIYPNPLNPRKYVLVYAASTPEGLRNCVKAAGESLPWNLPDAVVFDRRRWSEKDGGPFAAQFVFDAHWQLPDLRPVVELKQPVEPARLAELTAAAARESCAADVALAPIGLGLPAGAHCRQDLYFQLGDERYGLFTISGQDLRDLLEAKTKSKLSVAVAGLAGQPDLEQPVGRRAANLGIVPQRVYKVAAPCWWAEYDADVRQRCQAVEPWPEPLWPAVVQKLRL